MTHVPYRGAAPALTDILGGQVELMMADVPVVMPFIKGGKLKALAVTSAGRIPVLPQVPTTAEAGLPKVEVYNWYGMLAPAGTPPAIVERVHAALAQALRSPELKRIFAEQGVEVVASRPDEFGPFIYAETARWGALARSVGANQEVPAVDAAAWEFDADAATDARDRAGDGNGRAHRPCPGRQQPACAAGPPAGPIVRSRSPCRGRGRCVSALCAARLRPCGPAHAT